MSIAEFIISNVSVCVALISTGVLAGILAGLLGVGGGIVIVPVLYFIFQSVGVSAESAMLVATATSLATIVPTSFSSIYSHHNKANVDCDLLRRWTPFIFIGVLGGGWIVTRAEGSWLTLLFGTIAILSALNMLFRTEKTALFQKLPSNSGQAIMGVSIGFFSSMVGIGGGTISVPLLTIYNYPVHKAVGTAAAIGLFISLPGALLMWLIGNTPSDAPLGTYGLVNVIGLLLIAPFTVLCAPIGVFMAAKLDANKLKKIFAVVLLVTGLRMLLQLVL